MRKLFTAITMALVVLTTLSSCNKVLEGDFTFGCSIYSNLTSEDEDRFNEIVTIIKAEKFFTEEHSYHGTYADVSTKVANEFIASLNKIDQDAIQAKLKADEYIQIVLANKANGEEVAWALLTAEPDPDGDEKAGGE